MFSVCCDISTTIMWKSFCTYYVIVWKTILLIIMNCNYIIIISLIKCFCLFTATQQHRLTQSVGGVFEETSLTSVLCRGTEITHFCLNYTQATNTCSKFSHSRLIHLGPHIMINYAWNHLLMILIDNWISHYLVWNEISTSSTSHNFNEITYLNWKKTKHTSCKI